MKKTKKQANMMYLIFVLFMLFSFKIKAEIFEHVNPSLVMAGLAVSTYLLYKFIKPAKIKTMINYGKAKIAFYQAQMEFEASVARCLIGKKQTSFQETQEHIACWQRMKALEKKLSTVVCKD